MLDGEHPQRPRDRTPHQLIVGIAAGEPDEPPRHPAEGLAALAWHAGWQRTGEAAYIWTVQEIAGLLC
jgi:hypothetical protein